jgi:hypothetical protein
LEWSPTPSLEKFLAIVVCFSAMLPLHFNNESGQQRAITVPEVVLDGTID